MAATRGNEAQGRRATDFLDDVHGAGPHRCVAVEQAAVRMYKEALIRRMAEKNGPLDATDLEEVARQCADSPWGLSLVATKSYAACTEAERLAVHDGQRVDPFGRLVIETIGHLLAGKGEVSERTIERAHLPNLFKVFRAMLGDETIWARRRICQTILNELRFEHGNDFAWPLYHEDRRCKEILAQTVLDFLTHFQEFEHRVHWFLDVMNARPPAAEREDGGQRSTDFSEAHLFMLARAMIAAVDSHLAAAIAKRTDDPAIPFDQILARFTAGKRST